MSAASDPRLRLAPPDGRARFWLAAICWGLVPAIAAFALAATPLRGSLSAPLAPAAVAGGLALLCAALWRTLSWFMHRQSLQLSPELLDVRSSFYRCRTPLHALKLDRARVVDLDEQVQLRPTLKTNGFSIPGFHSGWFLLRNRRRTFVAIGNGRHRLWLPGSGRYDLLLEPVDPAALLARLRELAAANGRG